MNLPNTIRTVRWMIRDTFRQSISTKLFWVMLTLTLIGTAFCGSIRFQGEEQKSRYDWEVPTVLPKNEAERMGVDKIRDEGVRVAQGEISMGFGTISMPIGRSRDDSVRYLQIWIAGWIADTAGIMLALLWTAGFLPTFLEPHAATVLLAKPASRWSILLGKYFGVIGFVTVQATLFIAATWFAMGIVTGVWPESYWLAIPILVIHFSVFYAVSAFLAVWTRSTVASAFGTLLFWLLCWGINYSHFRLIATPVEGLSAASRFLLDLGYWTLPKPLDLSGIFFDAMNATGYSSKPYELIQAQEKGQFHAEASVAASLGFAAVTLGLAAYEFEQTDY